MVEDNRQLDAMQNQIPEEMMEQPDVMQEENVAATLPSSDGAEIDENQNENENEEQEEIVPDPESQDTVVPAIDQNYTNTFSKLMNKIANVFPDGNAFRAVFSKMADNLEAALGKQGYTVPEGMTAGAGSVGLGSAVMSDSMKNSKEQVFESKRKLTDSRGFEGSTFGTGTVKRESELQDYRVLDQMSDTMDKATDYVSPEEFLGGVDVMPRVRDVMEMGSQQMYQISMKELSSGDEEAAKQVSENYLHMFEQLQEFDQSMQNKIRLTYEGQEREQAMTKLGEYMQAMVDPMRDSLYEVDHDAKAPILDDQTRYQLDTMSFTGVKETYSCHEFDRDMRMDDLEDGFEFDPDTFVDGGVDVESDASMSDRYDGDRTKTVVSDYGYSAGVSSRSRGFAKPKQDRGAMAEEKFGHIGKDPLSQLEQQTGMEL